MTQKKSLKKSELIKELQNIEFILRQNNDKIGKFEDSSYTLGWISGIIERCNQCDTIY